MFSKALPIVKITIFPDQAMLESDAELSKSRENTGLWGSGSTIETRHIFYEHFLNRKLKYK